MTIEASTKTITEVEELNGTISVRCYYDINSNNNNNPSVYESRVVDENKEFDSIKGIEGELVISNDREKSQVSLDADGNLILSVDDDLATNYSINNENLEYNE